MASWTWSTCPWQVSLGKVSHGELPMASFPWRVAHSEFPMAGCSWQVAHGELLMACCPRPLRAAHGRCSWRVVHGKLDMVGQTWTRPKPSRGCLLVTWTVGK
ncbi:hypothetical protein Bca4012_037897 [Brassica carinata]